MNTFDTHSIKIGNIHGEYVSGHPHGEVIPAAKD
jgi:hypothetical protein